MKLKPQPQSGEFCLPWVPAPEVKLAAKTLAFIPPKCTMWPKTAHQLPRNRLSHLIDSANANILYHNALLHHESALFTHDSAFFNLIWLSVPPLQLRFLLITLEIFVPMTQIRYHLKEKMTSNVGFHIPSFQENLGIHMGKSLQSKIYSGAYSRALINAPQGEKTTMSWVITRIAHSRKPCCRYTCQFSDTS